MALVDAVVHAARALPGEGWGNRLTDEMGTGAAEAFLLMVRRQVHARAHGRDSFYSLETETIEPVDGLAAAAQELEKALGRLQTPLEELAKRLAARLDNEAAELDSDTRRRIEAVCRSLQRRGSVTLKGWRDMLKCIGQPATPGFVDWFGIERQDGRDMDVGMYRHYIDPTIPFVATVGSSGARHGRDLRDADGRHRRCRAGLAGGVGPDGSRPYGLAGASGQRAVALRLSGAHPGHGRQRCAEGRSGPGGRRLPGAVPGGGRRSARAVHRDQPAPRRLSADRRAAGTGGAAALWRSMSMGWTSRP